MFLQNNNTNDFCVCVCERDAVELRIDLKGLNEGPQQDADGFSLPQQLDETSCPEQPQETQVDEIILQSSHNRSTEGGWGCREDQVNGEKVSGEWEKEWEGKRIWGLKQRERFSVRQSVQANFLLDKQIINNYEKNNQSNSEEEGRFKLNTNNKNNKNK